MPACLGLSWEARTLHWSIWKFLEETTDLIRSKPFKGKYRRRTSLFPCIHAVRWLQKTRETWEQGGCHRTDHRSTGQKEIPSSGQPCKPEAWGVLVNSVSFTDLLEEHGFSAPSSTDPDLISLCMQNASGYIVPDLPQHPASGKRSENSHLKSEKSGSLTSIETLNKEEMLSSCTFHSSLLLQLCLGMGCFILCSWVLFYLQ